MKLTNRPFRTRLLLHRLAPVALLPSLLIAGCAPSPTTTRSVRQEATYTSAQRALAHDLEQLRGDDNLFTSDGDRDRPGLYTSAYGLHALADVGRAVTIDTDAAQLHDATAGELAAEPLWGRFYIAKIEQATGRLLHTADDISALRATYNAQGFFSDPGTAHSALSTDPGLRLADTAAVLQALTQFGAPPDAVQRDRIGSWLSTTGRAAASTLSQRWHWAQAAETLRLPLPTDTQQTLSHWWRTTGIHLSSAISGDAFVETCSYVQLAGMAGVDISAQAPQLRQALDQSAASATATTDPQMLALLTDAWQTLHGDQAALAPVRQAVRAHRLPSGLVSFTQQRQGDPGSSQAVETLRRLAGLPTADPRLATALRAMGNSDGGNALSKLLRQTVLASADRQPSSAATDHRLADLARQALPQPLTEANADTWFQAASILVDLHQPLPALGLQPWPTGTREGQYARNLAIQILAPASRLHLLPEPGTATELATQGYQLLRYGDIHEAQASLAAAALLGWHATSGQSTQALQWLGRWRGCPGTPSLFRERTASTCNIASTVAAWRLYGQLGLRPLRG